MPSVCSGLLQNVRRQKREGDEFKLEPEEFLISVITMEIYDEEIC